MVTAVIAPAHIRSMAKPGTDRGSPARMAAVRPMVRPWSPVWVAAAMATSSIRSGGRSGLPAQQFPDHLDDQVVGPGLRVLTLVAGLAERGAHALDEDHVAQGARRAGGAGR